MPCEGLLAIIQRRTHALIGKTRYVRIGVAVCVYGFNGFQDCMYAKYFVIYVLTIELSTIPRKCYIDNGTISCMGYTLSSVNYAQRSFEIHLWPFVLAAHDSLN